MKLLIFFTFITYSYTYPINNNCDQACLSYLKKYGYLESSESKNSTMSQLITPTEGINNFQKEAGFTPTGIIDDSLKKLIQTPRCGVGYRTKRFSVVNKWKTSKNANNETIVSWYLDLSNYGQIQTNLTKNEIESIFVHSFNAWSKTALLYFKKVSNETDANIVIKFLIGDHGDGFSFDGPGDVLAHAFYPDNGDIHLDNAEHWSTWGDDKSISLYSVAIHEIGHSLGLGHSSQSNSIMYAWYRPGYNTLNENDDVIGINNIYGIRQKFKFGPINPTSTTTNPTTTINPITTSTTTTRKKFTTKKYILNRGVNRVLIENSKVFIYPKSSQSLPLYL